MAKHSRKNIPRKSKKHNHKSHKKNTKKKYGGDLSDSNRNELLQLGFTNEDLNILAEYMPNMNLIKISLQQINPVTGNPFTPEELMQGLQDSINENEDNNEDNNELNLSNISNNSGDEHNLDDMNDFDESIIENNDSMNTTRENESGLNDATNDFSFDSPDGSLHLSDLDDSNTSHNTTKEEESFGGRSKKRRTLKKRKGRKSRKHRRKSRKQRGGMCYGTGVGANSYNPNFSVYNTNLLKLFPYKPIN
jgi:hypothetical protein